MATIDTVLCDLVGTLADCGGLAWAECARLDRPFQAWFGRAEAIPGVVDLCWALNRQKVRLGGWGELGDADVEAALGALRGWGVQPAGVFGVAAVPTGRPAPYLLQHAAMRLGSLDVRRCVVVGDEELDIETARNAGMWAVGVSLTGPGLGRRWTEVARMEGVRRAQLAAERVQALEAAGAHLVIDTVLDLPRALAVLERPSVILYKKWRRMR